MTMTMIGGRHPMLDGLAKVYRHGSFMPAIWPSTGWSRRCC